MFMANSYGEEVDLLIISEDEVGERLDKVLARRFNAKYSRTYFQFLIDKHLILVNGIAVKKRTLLQEGDEVEVQFVASPESNLMPENIPLSILYEDEHLLVINKPAGMVVHPAPGNWSGTFVNALLYYCQKLPLLPDTIRPGIVHRLDKGTSGLLVAAKTLETQQKLIELFASRKVYKAYLAICIGRPADGEIQAPIGRHPIHRKQMAVIPTGKPAISFCKTLGWSDKLSFVQIEIATGRTHQIRVHMKYRGSPILGDPLYGQISLNQYYSVPHQLLHAAVLRFQHPISLENLEFCTPPPPEMVRLIKKIDPKSPYIRDVE
ncbi:putative RNA pseudouridine synthase YlyB [Candidatus Protochlamydia amoebophila]|nr:putative RNA pseudouridine synthase YlyB [Candidatus Protochlamydia amoebophila]